MKSFLLGACSTALVLSATGCLQERTYLDPDVVVGGDMLPQSTMNLRNGRLAGDFGPRVGFDGPATRLEGVSDAEFGNTTVNVLREQNSAGAAMLIVNISGRTLDDLAPGVHPFSYDETSLDGSDVYVNVCGGVDSNEFDFDQPADSGSITVEETPEGRNITVHTETRPFDPITGNQVSTPQVTNSSFAYVP